MTFKLTILGSSSAVPAHGRNHTSQILHIYNNYFLIDCGEGTQHQLKRHKFNINKINVILISHLHGDHFLGLFGLISTMSLLGRTSELFLLGPKGLKEIITTQLKYSETVLRYPLHFQELPQDSHQQVFEFGNTKIHTIPLSHRIQCNGFLFRENPKPRRLVTDLIPENLPKRNYKDLKAGKDILDEDGNIVVKNDDVTMRPKKSRAYAYCSDTIYLESIIPILNNVDLLYHESTFLNDQLERAKNTFHTTAEEAGMLANAAQVKQLIIGHFSSRYRDLTPFEEEARMHFKNTSLAIEGRSFAIAD